MSNNPKADLIYAILAMDSYNRGYGAGIRNLADAENTQIGSFTVFDSKGDAEAKSAGFYAVAYRKGSETVISYRGTDVKGPLDSAALGGSDPINGYGIALGWTGNDADETFMNEYQLTTQSRLAEEFYSAVTARDIRVGDTSVLLTGHSLGGGLAAANDNRAVRRAA